MATITTLTFDDEINGWTSFWDYEPSFAFSVNGRYLTTKDGSLYEHYSSLNTNNHGYYYGTHYPAEITLVLNQSPSTNKVFKTINYEGSNGWKMSSFESNETYPNSNNYSPESISDTSDEIKSYSDGLYIENGVEYRVGFDRKENKYYANLNNNSVTLREGQVDEGVDISGIKGVFAVVTMKTDESTRIGGRKQLFSVSSEVVTSFN